jgi:hypothetical protein
MWKSKISVALVAGLLLTGALAGCSADSAHSSSGAAGSVTRPEAGVPLTNGGPADNLAKAAPAPGAVAQVKATLTPSDVQRSIIYNGSITVRVKDVDVAAATAVGLATGAGGYVGGDDRSDDSGRSTATLTLRVPAGSFDTILTALGKQLGSELNRHVSTQDVTSQVVDVQSRLATQQASVTRIRSLIAKTSSISEIVALEDELTTREADLESMEAQLRSLTDLASLSTITVILLGPEAQVTAPPAKKKTGFVAGLKSGWNGFTKSLSVLLTVLGAILPFVVAIGAVAWILLYFYRRRSPRVVVAPVESVE